jgi:hypothetical protein
MKKFIILSMLAMVVGMATQAQRATLFPLVVGDSVITSSSRDTVTKIITATAGYSALGIEVVGTKLSGTISAKAYLYGSVSGINYELTDSSAAFANQTTNTAFFKKTGGLPYVFYKVTVQDPIGGASSTQSMQVRVYYVLRRHD